MKYKIKVIKDDEAGDEEIDEDREYELWRDQQIDND